MPFARAIFALLSLTAGLGAQEVDFRRDVLPILSDACYHCHGPDENKREAKLRLDQKDGIFRTVDGITVVKPGDLTQSELIARITSDDDEERMPPRKGPQQLKPAQIETLKRWVAQGAKWSNHWAFEPMRRAAPPAAGQPIDAFVLDKLRANGIPGLSPEADKARLLRRVSFDLTGLPPSVAELDAFAADASPRAYEKAVDRLLASPRYGERLATEWLDVARYADTHGYQVDRARPVTAYRDWVIKSFNDNLPYDKFTTWQLAGDLLPKPTQEQQVATAFNRLHCQNEEGGIVGEEYRVAYVVDRVNTFATAFLGLTTECARCHDHKFDPFSQRDFYSLFAFFQNIDEAGQTSYFTDSMPVPTALLSTPAQDAKLADLAEKNAAAERGLAEARAAAKADFAVWVDKLPEGPGELKPDGEVAYFPFDSLEKNLTPNTVNPKQPGRGSEHPKLVAGKDGQGIELDGENGLTFPGLGHFTRSDAFTFSLWLQTPAGPPAARAVVLHHSKAPVDAGSRGYELLLEEGRIAFGLHHMWPGNSLKVATKRAVTPGAWTHVTVTYDGSSQARGLRLYLDGLPAEVEVVRDHLWKDITYGGGEPELAIGYRFRDAGFKGGRVDDFRIFGRALAPIEAAALAGRDDYTRAVQAFPEFSPAQHDALLEFYIATAHPASSEARKLLQAARDAQRTYINGIPEIMAMQELPQPKKAYILQRGAYDAHGAEVTAETPHILPAFPKNAPRNRLGLAQWLLEPEHPLTARVTVNRAWQMLFGRGLVETAENFGTTGTPPTHPELLDWLARDFVASGWDMKRLLKQIVMSATYRQASGRTSASAPAAELAHWALLAEKDPNNLLLSRAPARRLAAEMIRDEALAASGLLVEKQGGPSVRPYQPAGLWEEIAMGKPAYGQGHGEDLHRRSLYTFWKRTVPPPAMMTFDAADRSSCSVRRQSTSTPLQALTLLNDVQYVEAARFLGQRMLRGGGENLDAQISVLFRSVTSRMPSAKEQDVLRQLFTEQRAQFSADPTAAKKLLAVGEAKTEPILPPADLAAATTLALAILNHDEAIMRR
jgi:hypothetical protein